MAAEKKKAARAPGKGMGKLRGRMPTKRSINLMVVDESKIKPLPAILAILAILVLAAVFSKFLVIDRLNSINVAQAKVTRLQSQLDTAMDALENIGDMDKTYAHYTLDGMTAQELALVDRTEVVDLVISVLPPVPPGPTEADLPTIADRLFRKAPITGNASLDIARQLKRIALLEQLVPQPEYVINGWEVTGNLLTLDVTGQTLERMNELAREIEQSPIVDSCTISTAKKDVNNQSVDGVQTRFIVFLQKRADTGEEAAAEGGNPSSPIANFGAVTQFIGGEVSQSEGSEP